MVAPPPFFSPRGDHSRSPPLVNSSRDHSYVFNNTPHHLYSYFQPLFTSTSAMSGSLPPRQVEGDDNQASPSLYDCGDIIDTSTFEQILEMDDDEEQREFSTSIVIGFFEQAESTIDRMDEALKDKGLVSLSSLGHFLKGSSATLGLTKVKNSCEKIQHFGQMKDHEGLADEADEEQCLQRIENTLVILKQEYAEAEKILKKFFGLNTSTPTSGSAEITKSSETTASSTETAKTEQPNETTALLTIQETTDEDKSQTSHTPTTEKVEATVLQVTPKIAISNGNIAEKSAAIEMKSTEVVVCSDRNSVDQMVQKVHSAVALTAATS